MNNEAEKIRSFTQLNAWKEGHKLVLIIYKATKDFPREEIFGLTNQLRRAAVSFTSNIAEGFCRSTYRDKIRFYSTALGSLSEIQNQIIIARDIKYISPSQFNEIFELTVIVHKLTNGLIKKSRTRILDS